MKRILFLILLFILTSAIEILSLQNNFEIIVNIENVKSNDGNIRVQLYNESVRDAFPVESSKAIQLKVTHIIGNKSRVVFSGLPCGRYAITVHHDENLNVKMDKTFFGLPDEGWGVSNNIKPIMRIPDFDECSFEVCNHNSIIKITMNN